jgi:MarR family transcriptional regulator for hemolysin
VERPPSPPVGLSLAAAARVVSRAFDDALEQAGGTLPVWLVLLNLRIGAASNQRELAAAVGIREATLTHHLNAMERDGLVTRRRDPDNRRRQLVALTDAGLELFAALREVAVAFDAQLREGIDEGELTAFQLTLERLILNAADDTQEEVEWRGLADR